MIFFNTLGPSILCSVQRYLRENYNKPVEVQNYGHVYSYVGVYAKHGHKCRITTVKVML